MKRLALVLVVLVAIVTVYQPAAGQENLETRVSELETTVAELKGPPVPPLETTSPAEAFTIYGTFTVGDADREAVTVGPNSCSTLGGYRDVGYGTDGTVRDAAGNIIATSRLGGGMPIPDNFYACVFPFIVEAVPLADFYTIEVGSRGDVTYSAADLEAVDYHLDLTLGDPAFFFDYDFLTPTAIPPATSTPLPTPTPAPTSTPGPLGYLVLDSDGSSSQRFDVELQAGEWTAVLKANGAGELEARASFRSDVMEGRVEVVDGTIDGSGQVTGRFTVAAAGTGSVSVICSGADDWQLILSRLG